MPDLASLYIKVDSKGVVSASKDLEKLTDKSKKTEKATKDLADSYSKLSNRVNTFAKVAAAAAAAMALYQIQKQMREAIKAASDLQEVQGKFDVVFKGQQKTAESWAKTLVNSYAMSTREAKQFLSGIQDLLVPMGMSAEKAGEMSFEVVKLSADLASFNNLSTAQVMADIQSALVGNFETMKKYGVVLNETVIKQEAYSQGLWDGKGLIDANTKAQIAYTLMVKGSAAAIGDQQRTMGSYANQLKQLQANYEDISASIGNELLPQVTAWVHQVNESIKQNPEIIKQLGEFAKNILDLAEVMGKVIAKGAEFANVWTKTWQAWGLASTGAISVKEAIFNGVEAVEKFDAAYNHMGETLKKHPITAVNPGDVTKEEKAYFEAYEDLVKHKTEVDKKASSEKKKITLEMQKVQKDFLEAYEKSTLSAIDFEINSLDIQVEAFRNAKVNEIQLEEWKQNELINIKLRAQNEALELYETLAENDSSYAQKAIDIMSEILDAEEKKWAAILKNDDDAHKLRIQKEDEYKKKVIGDIEEITKAEKKATATITQATPGPGQIDSGEPSSGGVVSGKKYRMASKSARFVMLTPAVARQIELDRRNREAAPTHMQIAKAEADTAASLQKAAEAAEAIRKAAEDEANRLKELADNRVELEIQILEASGHATEALAIRRMQELALMDESLRPLQQRLYYLADEAEANEKAKIATEEAIQATLDLASAQDASISTFENSIALIVSQGQTIKDFIISLGITGLGMSLRESHNVYKRALAGAQAGDVDSYRQVTQGASDYISKAGQSAGSAVEMARIVAGIKRELSALEPVVDLESNIELLKAIKQATSDTATSVDRLDVLGIKADFDLEQVIRFVEDSTGLDESMRNLIINETADYQIFIQAQMAEDSSEEIKRVLIDGAGIYSATVNAALGTVDEESQRLAIQAQGDYLTTVNAAMGFSDPGAVQLALETTNEVLSTVRAALGEGDEEAVRLATEDAHELSAVVTAALAEDAGTQQLKDLLTGGEVTTTVDGTMSWNPSDPMKSVWDAINAQTAATKQATEDTAKGVKYSHITRSETAVAMEGMGGTYYITPSGWRADAPGLMTKLETIQNYATGGIASGPESGYLANLHGTELVVSPKTSYPVTVEGMDSGGDMDKEQKALLKRIAIAIESGSLAGVRNSTKIVKILTRFDDDGLPAERIV